MPTPPDEAERFLRRTTFLTAAVGQAATDAQTKELAALGLSTKAHGILAMLRQYGPLAQNELSRTMNAAASTVVTLVDGLERAGYVTRRGDPGDRRRNAVEITDSGREIAERADDLADHLEDRFLAPLTPGERDTLHTLLQRLWTPPQPP